MDYPILDPEKWLELVELEKEGNPGFIESLTSVFSAEAKESFDKMRDGVKSRDAEAVWHEAHKAKSSSGSLGAARMAYLCGQIEALGKAGSLTEVPTCIQQAETAFLSFMDALRDLRS